MSNLCNISNIKQMGDFIHNELSKLREVYLQKKREKDPALKQGFSSFIASKLGYIQSQYYKKTKETLPDIVLSAGLEAFTYDTENKDKIKETHSLDKGKIQAGLNKLRISLCQHPEIDYSNSGEAFLRLDSYYQDVLTEMRTSFVQNFIFDSKNKKYINSAKETQGLINNHKKQLIKKIDPTKSDEDIDSILKDAYTYLQFMHSDTVKSIILNTHPTSDLQSKNPDYDKYKALFILSNYDHLLNELVPTQIEYFNNSKGRFLISSQIKYQLGSDKSTVALFHEDEVDAVANMDGILKTIIQTIPRKDSEGNLTINDFTSFGAIIKHFYIENISHFKSNNFNLQTNSRETLNEIFNIFETSDDQDKYNSNSIKLLNQNANLIAAFRDYIKSLPSDSNSKWDIFTMMMSSILSLKNSCYVNYSQNDANLLHFLGKNQQFGITMQSLVQTIYNTIINIKQKLKSGEKYKNPLENENENENKQFVLNLLQKVEGLHNVDSDKIDKNIITTIKSAFAVPVDKGKNSIDKIEQKFKKNGESYYDSTTKLGQLIKNITNQSINEPYVQLQSKNKSKTMPLFGLTTSLENILWILTHPENQMYTSNLFMVYPELLQTSNDSSYTQPYITAFEFTADNSSDAIEVKKMNLDDLVANELVGNYIHLGKKGIFATRVGPYADKGTQELLSINTNAKILPLRLYNLLLDDGDKKLMSDTFGINSISISEMTLDQLRVLNYLTQKAFYKKIEDDIINTYNQILPNVEVSMDIEGSEKDYDDFECDTLSFSDALSDELMSLSELNNEDSKNKCK